MFPGGSLLRSVPRLYLGRLVRLYPVLMGALALQALALQATPGGGAGGGGGGARGPVFAQYVAGCRRGWWPVLLFVQNLVYTCSPGEDTYSLCLDLSYYLAIDTQLFFLSPLVLVCLVEGAGESGGARGAWAALFAALAGSLALATTISFYLNLPFVLSIDIVDPLSFDYYSQYYFHTLLRSPPYFIGMILGYVLHRSRKEPLVISKKCRISLWLTCGLLLALAGAAPLLCLRWQRPWLHNACNAAARSVWASAVAWIVVACHHNYGGVVSWFLSLAAWRPLSRLSYAVYLLHVPVLKLSAALAAADTVSVRDDFRAVNDTPLSRHSLADLRPWFLSLAAWRPLSRLSYTVYLLHVPVLKLSAALAAADTVSVRDDFRAAMQFFY
ncbi:hypothetical protein JYU34_009338 [Plutella xylostella]|uniref:Acyltransferase 3 domain-containing protein n=1 Tax=Plutella xylostella TaxID=51655 RepID=A0ABQ7QJ82_PLUXY|nr:hypothetical protein JYU34_009338 [Plutella xylostella]